MHDIVNLSPARQVVHRLAQPLQHRPQADPVGTALHRFVRGVAGIQVREDEHCGTPGHRAIRRQFPCNCRVGRRVILQRPIDQQRLRGTLCQAGRFAHFLDFFIAGRIA
ncbi:hypothetical protein D3C80_1956760 [compost metagenome]